MLPSKPKPRQMPGAQGKSRLFTSKKRAEACCLRRGEKKNKKFEGARIKKEQIEFSGVWTWCLGSTEDVRTKVRGFFGQVGKKIVTFMTPE